MKMKIVKTLYEVKRELEGIFEEYVPERVDIISTFEAGMIIVFGCREYLQVSGETEDFEIVYFKKIDKFLNANGDDYIKMFEE